MFHVGQKVVCIADYSEFAATAWAKALSAEFPAKGGVYTVRRLVQRAQAGDTHYGLLLHEVFNRPCPLDRDGEGGVGFSLDDPRLLRPDEMAFLATDFRPLITVDDFVDVGERVPVAA